MNITIETCKPDSYVGCPAPATPLPECITTASTGQTSCETVSTPPAGDLATTGVDPTVGLLVAWAMILAGAAGLASLRYRKAKR